MSEMGGRLKVRMRSEDGFNRGLGRGQGRGAQAGWTKTFTVKLFIVTVDGNKHPTCPNI